MKLGIVARSDHSGLGHQTRNLVRLLKPDKILLIDFKFYNGFEQHPEWYDGYDIQHVTGFIGEQQAREFLQTVDRVVTAETFYNNNFINIANEYNVQTYNQYNYEFFDPLKQRHLILPTKILSPSTWHLTDMQNQCSAGKIEYLPPPMFTEDFAEVREVNLNRKGKPRFLHVAGRMAAHDRAGTNDLLNALKYSKEDFDLVIKVQSGGNLFCDDPRVILDFNFPEDERELYRDFDAMIQPRRYGGLNLPMNEALSAGLPVIMTNISPNNGVLPEKWLVLTNSIGSFEARARIELFSAHPRILAEKLDELASRELDTDKHEAYNIAKRTFSPEVLLPRYEEILR